MYLIMNIEVIRVKFENVDWKEIFDGVCDGKIYRIKKTIWGYDINEVKDVQERGGMAFNNIIDTFVYILNMKRGEVAYIFYEAGMVWVNKIKFHRY